jgi:DNA-binding MarR family transcriptional regulator
VWEALKKHPGRSSKELSEVSNLDRYMIARRLPELEQYGLVSRVGSGSRDVRWFVREGDSTRGSGD